MMYTASFSPVNSNDTQDNVYGVTDSHCTNCISPLGLCNDWSSFYYPAALQIIRVVDSIIPHFAVLLAILAFYHTVQPVVVH